ncbi:MAG: AsmA family protein [Pseudomonadota bacterium]
MGKLLKIVFWIVGGLIMLLVATAIALPFFFDPNDYRDKIAEGVKESTGRDLQIRGDIKLNVFPWLAVSLGETVLGNAEGFGKEPFAEFKEIDVGVKLLPLVFERAVEVRTVKIAGLTLRLAKNKDGSNNWSDLSKPKKEEEKKAEEPATEGEVTISSFNIGGLEISDANLIYDDRQTGAAYRVEKLNLETGTLEPGKPAKFTLTGGVSAAKPALAADIKLATELDANLETKIFTLNDLALDVTLRGKDLPGGKQDLALRGAIHLDQSQGTVALKDLLLTVVGLKLKAAIEGSGLNGDAPKLKGTLSAEPFSPRLLLTGLGVKLPESADPGVLASASFNANYEGSLKGARLNNLALKLDQTSANGSMTVTDFASPVIGFTLKVDQFDADRYLPKPAEKSAAGSAKGNAGAGADDKIPIDALDKASISGIFEMAKFKLRNLTFTDVTLKLNAPKGAVKTQELSAKFYGGNISQSTRIMPGTRPAYAVNANLSGVNAGPVVRDYMNKDVIEGTAKVNAALTTNGLTVNDLKRALDGDLGFRFENGAVKGFNLAEVIRKSEALFNGQPYSPASEKATTDFSEVTGTAKITNGVLRSDDLAAKSPLFRLSGAGTADLVADKIDYIAKPTVVGTLTGQGGKEMDNLKGITIPITLYGALSAPQWKIDWGQIAKAKVMEKVNEQIDKKLKESGGDIGKALEGLFKKKE